MLKKSEVTSRPASRPLRDDIFKIVVNQSVDGLMVIDAEGIVRLANPAANALFAGKTTDLVGSHFGFPASDGPVELLLPCGNETLHVEMRSCEIKWEGRMASLASLRDVTAHKKLQHALRERVKELRCLFELSRVVEREGISTEEILEQTVHLMPPAWQFPDSTVGRIEFHDLVFETGDLASCISRMSTELLSDDEVVGAIRVGYREEHPPAAEGPFLQEERELLEMLAERLGHFIERRRSAEALRESARQYRLLADNTLDVIWAMNMDLEFTYVNPAITRLTGHTPEEFLRTHLSHYFAEAAYAKLRKVIEREIARGPAQAGLIYETELIRKAGSPVSVEIHGRVIFDENGAPIAFQGTTRDITERKRAERALRDNEARYRALAESANDAFVTANSRGDIVGWNRGAERLFGYTEAEAIGQPVTLLVPTQYQTRHLRGIERIRTGGDNPILGKTVELEGRRKDGKNCPIELSLARWRVGEGTFYSGIIRDISERKGAEAERERLLLAIEHVAGAIIITDTNGTIQYVNPAFEEVTGYAREQALGQNPRILKSGEHDREFYRKLWQTLAGGNTWQGRIVNKRPDGTRYTEEGAISPVRDQHGKIVNYVSAMRDITQELELEQQLRQAQKMESVGRLAGGVAHDFNNMLSVILGNAELALEGLGPSDALQEELQEILKAAQRSADLTRQLLAFARKQTIAPKVVDLNDTIAGMLKMLGRMIGEDIHLQWKPAANLWPVKVDPGQIDQILANLVVNARDAIDGVGHLTIETGKVELDANYCARHPGFVPGHYVMLAVSDDGSGMDDETLAQVFEPFFTTKPAAGGTGLGLSTVYGIVKQNEGFITVHSARGKGTSFKIYLPQVGEGDIRPEDEKGNTKPETGTETVLLVEDELPLLELTTRLLERLGYTVLATGDPEKALQLAREHPSTIHVLLTDVVMPGMSGRDLSRELAELRPDLKSLFMSGYTANAIAHQGVLDQDIHFLEKPFTIQILAAKVREALEN